MSKSRKKKRRPIMPATRRNLSLELRLAQAQITVLKGRLANARDLITTLRDALGEQAAELAKLRGLKNAGIVLPGPGSGGDVPPIDLLRA